MNEQLTGWSPRAGGGWERNAYNERNAAAIAANRSWAGAGAGASARVIATDVAVIAGRAGSLPVASSIAVGIGEAAGAVARCIGGGIPVCAAASAAAAAYAAYRIYADEDGDLMSDPGTPTVSTNGRKAGPFANGSYYSGLTAYDVAIAAAPGEQSWMRSHGYPNCIVTPVNPSPGSTTGYRDYSSCSSSGTRSFPTTGSTVTACPASVDPGNGAYSVPAGSPVGPDGKCPTARYNHIPTTAEAAAGKVAANPPTDPTPWVQPTKDAIQSGGQQAPASIETTGPASQTGSGTTTTTTGGSPAQTTVETKTPTYTYNYAGDTITYNTSYTTINNNITTGTTTTTTETPAPATPQDPEDPCTAEPDRLGCIKLGKPPDDQVPTKSSEISYSAESVGLPSGCPSPKTIAGKSFSYEPICETATNARPWVIVGAVFSALMLMLAGVRQV